MAAEQQCKVERENHYRICWLPKSYCTIGKPVFSGWVVTHVWRTTRTRNANEDFWHYTLGSKGKSGDLKNED